METIRRIEVRHARGSYPVLVGEGVLAACRRDLAEWAGGRRVFVVSSAPVLRLHGTLLRSALPSSSTLVDLEVPDGEAAKTLAVAGALWEGMLARGGKRDSRLMTLGGGSVGDVGGFAAACFLRGIEFVQVPTTLLAQVDASVGGKTGIDLPGGKNTVGAFWQPAGVLADTGLLATLPPEEIRAGLVEVIKMAATLDCTLFEEIEAGLAGLLAGDPARLAEAVAGAVEAKRGVVEEDPEEKDRRRLLNFGHTLAHALETALGYGALRHGEAVGHGMLFALRLARRRGLADDAATRIETLVRRLDLPAVPAVARDEVLAAMHRDKKARESGLAWVLPTALGRASVVEDVSWSEVEADLDAFLAGR